MHILICSLFTMVRTTCSLFAVLVFIIRSQANNVDEFPKDFEFGAASAAFQIEGAWNEDNKGPSVWDDITHNYPMIIADQSNADIACDSYHRYKEDVAMLKNLSVQYYRFSLSWPRILPRGTINYINQAGVDYYNNLINELIANGIQPMVTLYHWDMPSSLNYMGGFHNPMIIDHFINYANLSFALFGDRVKMWTTFNEPKSFCIDNSDGAGMWYFIWYPLGLMEYACSHNIIRAHSRVYHMYNRDYRSSQKGTVSIALNFEWDEPATNNISDILATNRRRQFDFGLFFHPLTFGDYPPELKEQIARYSKIQGFPKSRLPVFTLEDILLNIGSYDYLGLNHYSSWMVQNGDGVVNITNPSYINDYDATSYKDPSWGESALSWLRVAPKMFRKILNWIKVTYNNPKIVITENGFADTGELKDTGRISYIQQYLSELLKAINIDKVRVIKYTHWALMDNFEWTSGYSARLGLYHVDFNDPNRTRTAKASVDYYRKIIQTKKVPDVQ